MFGKDHTCFISLLIIIRYTELLIVAPDNGKGIHLILSKIESLICQVLGVKFNDHLAVQIYYILYIRDELRCFLVLL